MTTVESTEDDDVHRDEQYNNEQPKRENLQSAWGSLR